MRLGALLGPIDAAAPRALAEQARRYAGEGFQSLWSAQAIGRGFMFTDPFVALSVAASVTDSIEIGTAVIQVPLYHPVDLAHRVFSLQQICGDRLILGVGAGSTERDFAAFGRQYPERFKQFTADIDALRTLFADGRLGDVDLSPWRTVVGGPPLFFGTWGNGVERAAKAFDGWIASAHYRTPAEVVAALARYREAAKSGRAAGGAAADGGAQGSRAIVSTIQIGAGADLGELEAKLDTFADAGFDDAVVMLLPGAPDPARIRKLVG